MEHLRIDVWDLEEFVPLLVGDRRLRHEVRPLDEAGAAKHLLFAQYDWRVIVAKPQEIPLLGPLKWLQLEKDRRIEPRCQVYAFVIAPGDRQWLRGQVGRRLKLDKLQRYRAEKVRLAGIRRLESRQQNRQLAKRRIVRILVVDDQHLAAVSKRDQPLQNVDRR